MIDLLKNRSNSDRKLAALIDGEHYPQINLDAIKLLKKSFKGSFCGIIFLGGTEKLMSEDLDSFYGHKVIKINDLDTDFLKALDVLGPDIVYDLSDEPVVNYIARMKIASYSFARKCSYMGPDFYFEYETKTLKPAGRSLLVIGTGKRIGKTAVSSYLAKTFSSKRKTCIIAMGRGGPTKPLIIKGSEIEITPEYLLSISRSGMHASSDYIEDALFSRVDTIGCRRCGGGFGGKFFLSNIDAGVKLCESLSPEITLVEGSGASVPAVITDRQVCVIGASQSWDSLVGYMGLYRILTSDLVFLTMCEEPFGDLAKIDFLVGEIKKARPDIKIIKSVFRPEPLYNIKGKKVFMVLTASSLVEEKISRYLEKEYSCKVVKASFNLANRPKLKVELDGFDDYDVLLTELKAASVDMVTEYAYKAGKEINYMNNIPVIVEGASELNDFIEDLIKAGIN
jgi:cyclic 2,3-diphosphoglycerate synthetase